MPFSDKRNARFLATNGTAENETVPAGYNLVVFSATAPFWANIGGTAVKPTADVTNGTASDFNPAGYCVKSGDVISLVADAANVIVHCRYYRVQ